MLFGPEEWVDIRNFEGYQVSNYGYVRTFWAVIKHGRGARRVLVTTPRQLPMSDDGNGYLKVCLVKDEKKYMPKVHKLVADAFIPNPNPEIYDTVDHIKPGPNGKLDNSVWNLQAYHLALV